MNQKLINQLLNQAKELLAHQPLDAVHDLAHAKAVWSTAKDLAAYIPEKINLDILKIACYWHDVVVLPKGQLHPAGENVADTANYLKTKMQDLQIPADLINTTYLAVRYHQFDDEPINLEGQVLWDADKLETLNLDRWLQTKSALDSGQMSQATFDSYLHTGLNWLKVLHPTFHFDYSRTLFGQRLQALITHPEFQLIAKKYKLNLAIFLKS